MSKVISNLWFTEQVREAVEFYVSVVPDSAIIRTTDVPTEAAGGVKVVEFRLGGQNFVAFEAEPFEAFNHAFSIAVECDSQEELDRVWDAFLAHGGTAEHCGWLKDRWGLSWQIVPRVLGDMVADPDRERARRATEAMLSMIKFDIAALERAFHG
jgi:predicted 3-demethylubiquinone-9 3-methyltransferase (glyoxalase superfamily)